MNPKVTKRRWSLDDLGWGVLVAHLFLSPLLFSNDMIESVESAKVALLMLAALVLAALGLCHWLGRNDRGQALSEGMRGLCRDPIAVGVILFLVSATLSTIFSVSPRISYLGEPGSESGWLTLLGYTILFFATRRLGRSADDARRLLSVAAVAAAIASSYALAQVAHADPIAWDNTSNMGLYVRPFATMGHPNFLAAYLVMVLPIFLCLADSAWAQGNRQALSVLAAAGVLCCCTIFITLSRGAWVALACCLVTFCAGWFRIGRGRRIAGTILIVLLLAAAGFAIACLVSPHGGELVQNLGRRVRFFTHADSRHHIWMVALDLFRDHPWLGCGVDTFHLAFGQKRPVAYWYTEWNTTPLRAHNIGLQVLATQGIVGALAGLVFVTGLLFSGRRAWRRAGPPAKVLLIVISTALLGFFIQNLFSFTVTGLGTLFVTLAALLSRMGDFNASNQAAPRPRRNMLVLAACVALLLFWRNVSQSDNPQGIASMLALAGIVLTGIVVLWVVMRLDGEDRAELDDAVESPAWVRLAQLGTCVAFGLLAWTWVVDPLRASLACRQGDRWMESAPQLAVDKYQVAIEMAPGPAAYRVKLGAAALACAQQEGDAKRRREWLAQARTAFEQAVAMVPINAYQHACLGRTLMELARLHAAGQDEVFAAYDTALALDPHHAYYYGDAANAALILNRLDRANDYAQRGLTLYPHFGLLRAHVGFVALLERRHDEAVRLLTDALASSWYLEERARRFTETMLEKAQQQLETSRHPPHGRGQRPPSRAAGAAASAFE